MGYIHVQHSTGYSLLKQPVDLEVTAAATVKFRVCWFTYKQGWSYTLTSADSNQSEVEGTGVCFKIIMDFDAQSKLFTIRRTFQDQLTSEMDAVAEE